MPTTEPGNITQPLPSELLLHRVNSSILLGTELPPIWTKLVIKIEASEFIEIAELLPDRLDSTKAFDKPEQQKINRRYNIINIVKLLEWTKCFAIYTVVFCTEKLPDMLSYLILIIQTHMEYYGDA